MNAALPLAGVRVVELTHMVMGPTCGMLLADLGADVIKVEPLKGDNTRRLLGSGAGFFPLYNRNKRSFAVDVDTAAGKLAVHQLIDQADVVAHNFKASTMQQRGFDFAQLCARRPAHAPALIYVDLRGFLPGPYEQRPALDEVVQMMGGLAYMTGRRGDPLRAGSSVNDMMGGIFGALACMAALMQRAQTGQGQAVQAGLFENNLLLVAQHMMQFQVTGAAAAPMPERISPWGIYDVFTVQAGAQVFLSVVTDSQWQVFCQTFEFADWQRDPRLTDNNLRVLARPWLLPELRTRLAPYSAQQIEHIFEQHGLPFAPIKAPHELFDDPQVKASGSLAAITLPDGARAGSTVQTVLFPFKLNGAQLGVVRSPPLIGEHSSEILTALGYDAAQIATLAQQNVIRLTPCTPEATPQSSQQSA